MTRDDIIRMAREAGFVDASFCRWSAYSDDLERFAELVAAAEREACAKLCERIEDEMRMRSNLSTGLDSTYSKGRLFGAAMCSEQIRARGEK